MIYQAHYTLSGMLFSLLLIFFAIPFVEEVGFERSLLIGLFTLSMCAGVYGVAHRRLLLVVLLLLAIPSTFINWHAAFGDGHIVVSLSMGFTIVFYTAITAILSVYVFSQRRVNYHLVAGAVCIYLLIGLIGALAYTLIEFLQPGSFAGLNLVESSNSHEQMTNLFNALFYFSYVTLTTLGYGNIAPTTTLTSMLTSLEAIIGQLYIAILVARLMGLHILYSSRNN